MINIDTQILNSKDNIKEFIYCILVLFYIILNLKT
jgi:hypothetical protein